MFSVMTHLQRPHGVFICQVASIRCWPNHILPYVEELLSVRKVSCFLRFVHVVAIVVEWHIQIDGITKREKGTFKGITERCWEKHPEGPRRVQGDIFRPRWKGRRIGHLVRPEIFLSLQCDVLCFIHFFFLVWPRFHLFFFSRRLVSLFFFLSRVSGAIKIIGVCGGKEWQGGKKLKKKIFFSFSILILYAQKHFFSTKMSSRTSALIEYQIVGNAENYLYSRK